MRPFRAPTAAAPVRARLAEAPVSDTRDEAQGGLRQIVDSENRPPSFYAGNSACSLKAAAEFADAGHWDELAGKHLSRYDLPRWSVRADPQNLALWLDRVDLPVRTFLRSGGWQTLAEVITLNPTWPLRAFVGLALEAKVGQ